MPQNKLLVYVFADLLRDNEGLQGKVISDPQSAMKDYGLSTKQIKVLNALKVNKRTMTSSKTSISDLKDLMIDEMRKLCDQIIKKNLAV